MRIVIEHGYTPQIIHTTNRLHNCGQMVETDKYIFVSEGVCTAGEVTPAYIQNEIENKGIEHAQRKYKGAWVAAYYDKQCQKVYICNDLLSKKAVFYYCTASLIIVDTSFFDLCAVLRERKITPQINQAAVKRMCEKGVFEGSLTYEENTKWLFPYMALKIDLDTLLIEEPTLPIPEMKRESDLEMESAVHTIEQLFSQACRQQWQLNKQVGTDQIVTLSGGMDSRATFYHMMKLAREENCAIHTYTYAQTKSLDETIPATLAKKNATKHRFIPLDDCRFLWKRDQIIRTNEGQTHYAGTTGAVLLAEEIKQNNIAFVVHTGLGGGEIFGDICRKEFDSQTVEFGSLTMTKNQWRNLNDMRVCLAFQLTTADVFSAISPFLDEEFFEYCMCLPTQWKLERKIYGKWYQAYMDTTVPITGTEKRIGARSFAGNLVRRIIKKLAKLTNHKTKYDMVPFSYWYAQNEKIREFTDDQFSKDISALANEGIDTACLSRYWKNDLVMRERVLTATYVWLQMLGKNE